MSNDITDLTPACAPKSDQINADDLIGGPITVTVVRVVDGPDPIGQPIEIVLAECKPYRPSKGMRRVLLAAWGKDPRQWPTPARMTLYRDPSVRFGSETVGGIRVSHLSGIPGRLDLPMTLTKGKRTLHRVEPLVDVVDPVQAAIDDVAVRAPARWDEAIAIANDNRISLEERAKRIRVLA